MRARLIPEVTTLPQGPLCVRIPRVSKDRTWIAFLPPLFLAAFALQVLLPLAVFTATSDETSHLPAGYTYLVTGDLRLNPQHPPLIKLLAALPLLAVGPRLDLADPGWTAQPPDEWGFGARFLYGNDADRLLFLGRLPVVLLGIALGVYVAIWALDLWGAAGAAVSTALYAFCPVVVGHARWVTMDVGVAAFATAALYHLWSRVRGGGPVHLVLGGLLLGGALASKFSAVLLLPVLLALLLLERRARAVVEGAAIAVLAAAVVWAAYLFPADPLVYFRGLLRVQADHDPNYEDYLLGTFRRGGFPFYFPIAFLAKTPLPTLVALALSALPLRGRGAAGRRDALWLLLPAAAWAGGTIALAADIGVRYLIPAMPLLFVWAGRLGPAALRSRAAVAVAASLLAVLAAGTLRVHPDQLAYFNAAAGGPSRGYEILDDSNLDWGQDLKRLKLWMNRNGVDAIRLLYPWNGNPAYYGIRSEPVTAHDWLVAPRPGLYAISVQALVRGRETARAEGAASDWLDRYRPVDRIGYSFLVYRFGGAGVGP